MKHEFKYDKGEVLKDIITGYKGVVMEATTYLTGCDTYGLQSKVLDKEGTPRGWQWFDENRLVKTKGKTITLTEKIVQIKKLKVKGGPQPNAPQR